MAETENKVSYGLKNVHYAVWDDTSSKYGEWKTLPGAVKMTGDAQGDQSKFYADDIVYYIANAAASETGTIELANLSDEAKKDLLGWANDATSGLDYLATNAKRPSFALGYEVQGDVHARRGIRYNCTLSLPSQESNTMNESVTPDTMTLNYTAVGRDFTVGGAKVNVLKAAMAAGDAAESYDKFFTKVIMPGTAVE